MPCPTCGAETRPGQRFSADCGTGLDATAPTNELPTTPAAPAVAPTVVVPVVPPVAVQPPPAPVPIRIVEQTTPLPTTGRATSTFAPEQPGTHAAQHEVGGMVWHPIAVDPWPTPRSSPTVVAVPVRPGPLTVVGLVAAALGVAGSIVTVGSYRFADGTAVRFTLGDLRSNSLGVMLAAAITLVVGVGLALGRQRVGVGLAGGAAVSMAGLAAMDAALIVAQLVEARRAGLATGVVTITWNAGFFLVVAAGVLGLVTAAIALGAWRDAEPMVPVVVTVLGVLAAAAVVVGALIPPEGRTWGDNLSIPGFGAVPSWLRLGALALVGTGIVIGFAARRRWTMGLAVGSTAALVAQWIGVWSPPVPNRRGGPGIAITPLEGTTLTVHAAGLVFVVGLALLGWLLAGRRV